MAHTDVYAALAPNVFNTEVWKPTQCVKGDPKDTVPKPYHEPLEKASHTVLQVPRAVSPDPESFSVNVFNGSTGMKLPVTVRSSDTIEALQQEVLKLIPDPKVRLNLAYNGKPLKKHQILCDLQVKPGATFIIYQKCHGV